MEVSRWIRHEREKLGLDQKTLAQKAQLNAGTISRVETESTNPTLDTVIRIAKALDISMTNLQRVILDKSLSDPTEHIEQTESENRFPTIDDVHAFEQFCINHWKDARELLSKWLNEIVLRIDKNRPPVIFSPDQIESFWFRSQVVSSFELDYPVWLEADIILTANRQGGILLRQDAFIVVREELVKLKIPLRGNDNAFPLFIYHQFRYADSARKVKLTDIIRLDKMCGGKGTIVDICLKAIEFDILISPYALQLIEYVSRPSDWRFVEEFRMGYALVLISRWIEYVRNVDKIDYFLDGWLQDLRERISAPKESN